MRDPEKQRAAKRRYYQRNPEVYRQRNLRAKERNMRLLLEAKSRPCADCQVEYPPYVMQFDHLDAATKLRPVSKMTAWSLPALMREMEKCEIVCANCHAERTHSRAVSSLV